MSHGIRWSNLTVAGRIVALTLLTLAIAIGLLAQDTAKPKVYTPTEVQSLRLQVKQRDALLAKQNLESAQRAFQQALTDLSAEGEKVKHENKWPDDTNFDPNSLQYSAAPAKDVAKDKKP
jgi:hypothetical protein